MRVLSKQIVVNLAREMGRLNIHEETITGIVHTLDTEKQAQEMLKFLQENQPTKAEIMKKLREIID